MAASTIASLGVHSVIEAQSLVRPGGIGLCRCM